MRLPRPVLLQLTIVIIAFSWVSCGDGSSDTTDLETMWSDAYFSEPKKIDFLWVVGNSSSMQNKQTHLRNGVGAFINTLVRSKFDFQLAVITTDMENPAESGRFQNIPNTLQASPNVPTPDVSQCPTKLGKEAPPLVIRSDDPRYLDENGEPDTDKLVRDFGCNATVGITGSGFGMGLESARTALSPALTQGYNAGFLRDDAFLAIIFLSDENDCSDGGALNLTNDYVCEWERDSLIPVQEYIDFFSSLKKDLNGDPDLEKVIMASILAPDKGLRYDRNEEVIPSCPPTDNGESASRGGYAGYRYSSVLGAFPNNYEGNICDPPFDQDLEAIGLLPSFPKSNCFALHLIVPCRNNADCNLGTCETFNTFSSSGTPETFSNCSPNTKRTLQFAVERPVGDGLPAGFELVEDETLLTPGSARCAELSDTRQGTYRCILVENIHYTLTNNPSCATFNGLAVDVTYEQGSRDKLIFRDLYPHEITTEAKP